MLNYNFLFLKINLLSIHNLLTSSQKEFDMRSTFSTINVKSQPIGLAFLFSGNALKVNFQKQTLKIKNRCEAATFTM